MRQSCLRAAIGSALLLIASPIFARDAFTIPTSFPDSYENLYKTVKKDLEKDPNEAKQKAKEQQNISAYLDGAQCGGWNMGESVDGKIADVSNAPGHTGQWNGNIPSGMAARQGELTYPEETTGLSTICEEKKGTINKRHWVRTGTYSIEGYELIDDVTEDVTHPYFEDPACLWIDNTKQEGPQTPPKCRATCGWINGFSYEDCREPGIGMVCNADDDCDFVDVCLDASPLRRYTCSDEWMDDQQAQKNCRECAGEECRCGNGESSCFEGRINGKPYASFFRRYDTSYTRDAVPDAPKDVTSKQARVACYGRYDEFDPKTHQTEDKDMRCIVDINLETMKETQKGKGQYGEQSNLADPAPATRNDGEFDEKKDLWYTQLGQSFSLISDVLFTNTYDRSIGKVLMNKDKLDSASQKATVQLTEEKPLAEHSYTRAFDETAESRVIAQWWQEQQTLLQTYVHGPVLRLVLPSTWAIGASTDPFLDTASVSLPEESTDDRSKSIEVQIGAEEDTLGEAIAFIERSFTLQVVEEPIPVTIPLADPVELRATAASWCAWASATSESGNCQNAPANVKKLIDSLQTYADEIEEYRTLRTLLAEHITEVLKLQNDVVKPLTDWMKTNIGKYKEGVAARKQIAKDVAPTLEMVQQLLQVFANTTNMPWCMNQRFTIPIYSLLDPWLPSRAAGGAISAEGLPSFPKVENIPQDIVIDISRMTYMQTPFTIPVLKPTQIRLDIPKPPNEEAIKELPDIGADIERIKNALRESREQLPDVKTKGNPPAVTLPEPIKQSVITDMKEKANAMLSVFSKMERAYSDFWESMGPLRPDGTPANKPQDEWTAAEKKAAWTEAEKKIAKQKANLECDWGTFPCIHVEMDLLERLTRIGSRPLVMLKEDYDSKGVARTSAAICPPSDHVCLLMHPELTKPVQGWEIRGPTKESIAGLLDTLRSAMLSITFTSPIGSADVDSIPPYDTTDAERAKGMVTAPSSPILPVSAP